MQHETKGEKRLTSTEKALVKGYNTLNKGKEISESDIEKDMLSESNSVRAWFFQRIKDKIASQSGQPDVEQPVIEEAVPLPEPQAEPPITGDQNALNAPNSTADTETSPDGTLNSPQPDIALTRNSEGNYGARSWERGAGMHKPSPQAEQPVTEEAAPLPEPPQEQPITGGQNTLNGQSTLDAPNSTADTETSPVGTLNSTQTYPPAQPSVESEGKQSSAQQNRM